MKRFYVARGRAGSDCDFQRLHQHLPYAQTDVSSQNMERRTVTLDDIDRRLTQEHREPYYQWIKHLVNLSSGALTLLVSLQNTYLPKHPQGIFLLKGCWISLAIAILFGLLTLYGESQSCLDAANDLRRKRRTLGDERAALLLSQEDGYMPRRIFRLSYSATVLGFASATVLLVLFAVWNLPL